MPQPLDYHKPTRRRWPNPLRGRGSVGVLLIGCAMWTIPEPPEVAGQFILPSILAVAGCWALATHMLKRS